MLPTAFRLSLREYPDFFSSSRKAFSPRLIVYWRKQTPTGATVVVAKKQLATAVERNLVKRKIRAALKETQSIWSIYQVVVVAKRNVLQSEVSEISHDLQQIFSKINAEH